MEALEVRLELRTPMHAPSSPIHLDAVLAALVVARAGGDWAAQEDLSLARYGEGDAWVWRASRCALRVVGRTNIPAVRKVEAVAMAEDRGRRFVGGPATVSLGTGPYKAYTFSYPALTVPEVRAWCVGDREAIVDLLGELRHFGKLGRLDFGRVGAVEVRVDPEPERERWRVRTMPAPMAGYHGAIGRLRSPYWSREGREAAWEPGDAAVAAIERWG